MEGQAALDANKILINKEPMAGYRLLDKHYEQRAVLAANLHIGLECSMVRESAMAVLVGLDQEDQRTLQEVMASPSTLFGQCLEVMEVMEPREAEEA